MWASRMKPASKAVWLMYKCKPCGLSGKEKGNLDMLEAKPDLFDLSKPYIKGKLRYEIFHNPDNFYTVSRVKIVETTEELTDEEITVVGYYPPLLEGDTYLFWGELKIHPRYGKQYELKHIQKEQPQGREGLIQYLSSDLFPGIGPKTAALIVQELGDEAVRLILEDPQVLDRIPRLNEAQRKILYEGLLEYQGLERVMATLGRFGIGLSLAVQIYRAYGPQALEILRENPYRLMTDIEGIGFKRADQIAKAMGISPRDPARIRACCLYSVLRAAENFGHVYYPLDLAIKASLEELNKELDEGEPLDEQEVAEHFMELAREEELILEEDRLYLPSLYFAEKGFAKKVRNLLGQRISSPLSPGEWPKILEELEKELGVRYAPSQRLAIEEALRSPLLIITGGPGTGKTTVIKAIVHSFARLNHLALDPAHYVNKDEPYPFLLVAPTGRAAKRLGESTGLPSFTIHRLLGWRGGDVFEFDDEHPLAGRLLIVDEATMMDQWLANQLFRALPDDIQVVLVGDEDQLPSVGPGQVLTDLLRCSSIPVVHLQEIHRQAGHSTIIKLAHQIKEGHLELDLYRPRKDFRFFPCTSEQVVETVGQICRWALEQGYETREIQVLAPMYKGKAGIHALNKHLQDIFNPPGKEKRELVFGSHVFRVGDKVLQLVNNSEEQVFNGDVGRVVAILDQRESPDGKEGLVVRFDEREVRYERSQLNQLSLAYCCSIHKAQGSEYPLVVIPLVNAYWPMLRRNLVYTAVTRGKEQLIFCGDIKAIETAIARQETASRLTTLQESIEGPIGKHS